MNNKVIGELVLAYVKARRLSRPMEPKEVAGMLITQYGIREAYKTIDKINAGATEGFWKSVLGYLEMAIEQGQVSSPGKG